MPLTSADRVALHQLRKEAQGHKRVSVYVSPEALAAVARVIADTGCTQQDAINQLLKEPKMTDPLAPVDEISYPNLSAEERAALHEHQTHTLTEAQMQRETNWNGGAAPEGELTQKQRVEASFLAGNIHRK